jgi:hypothetical protein
LPNKSLLRRIIEKTSGVLVGHRLGRNLMQLKPSTEPGSGPDLLAEALSFKPLSIEQLSELVEIRRQWTFGLPRQGPYSSPINLHFALLPRLEGARLCRLKLTRLPD